MDENIKILLTKYITGDADEMERTRARLWIRESPDNLETFISLKATWQDSLHHPGEKVVDADTAFIQLTKRLGIQPAQSTTSATTPATQPAAHTGESPTDLPGGNQQAHRSRWLRIPKAAVIAGLLLAAGGIAIGLYRKNSPRPLQQSAFEIFVPKGKMKKIRLPDSSEVWLNAGTRFSYAAGFGESNREVSLEGEGYFAVRHNDQLPFLVRAHGYTIRDIGTIFTINAYADNKNFETAVIEGKIEVTGNLAPTGQAQTNNGDNTDKILLAKNEVLKIPTPSESPDTAAIRGTGSQDAQGQNTENPNAEAGNAGGRNTSSPNAKNRNASIRALISSESEMDSYAGWKDHLLVFNEETFDEVAKRLERSFDVKIRINSDQLAHFRYTGRFNKVQGITDALKIIQETTPIIYHLEKGAIIISLKHSFSSP